MERLIGKQNTHRAFSANGYLLLLKPEKFYGLFGTSMVLMCSVFHGFGQVFSLNNVEFAGVVGLVFWTNLWYNNLTPHFAGKAVGGWENIVS